MKRDFLPAKSDVVFKLLFGDERNADLLTDLLKAVLDLPADEYDEIIIADPHLLRACLSQSFALDDKPDSEANAVSGGAKRSFALTPPATSSAYST